MVTGSQRLRDIEKAAKAERKGMWVMRLLLNWPCQGWLGPTLSASTHPPIQACTVDPSHQAHNSSRVIVGISWSTEGFGHLHQVGSGGRASWGYLTRALLLPSLLFFYTPTVPVL